ncbi:MAG: class I SAM-dependent methyltransferase, partial [bacterium]
MSQGYTTVTEVPGSGATREQLAMLYTRYHFAATHCAGKDVLEVACGPGIGLGYLGRSARVVVGGDYDETMLQTAHAHYRDRARVLRLDAHTLPFAGRAFDVIILFEA